MEKSITNLKLSWNDASNEEIQLARGVAEYLVKMTRSPDELSDLVYSLAAKCSEGDSSQYRRDEVEGLFTAFPQLNHIDTSIPFAQGEVISAGFFGRLASEIIRLNGLTKQQGIVTTPPILAFDMACLSIATLMARRLNSPVQSCFDYAAGIAPIPDNLKEEIREITSNVVWYDPCVGTGTFPICIFLALQNLVLSIPIDLLSQFDACDSDIVSLWAAKIRVAFLLSTITKVKFVDLVDNLKHRMINENSLKYFATQDMLQIPSSDGFERKKDIVIGNPPYLRSEKIPTEMGDFLRHSYPEVSKEKVDLYNYFIVHGIYALRDEGLLCYVSPASFQRTRSGRTTRRIIAENASVEAIFDFDELPVFESVSVHSTVYLLRKNCRNTEATVATYDSLPKEHPLYHGLKQSSHVPAELCTEVGWVLHAPETLKLLGRLEQRGIPLIDYVQDILSGIKTGCNEAYYLNSDQAAKLMTTDVGKNHIYPLLHPKHIRTYSSEWQGTHIIIIKKDETIPHDSELMRHLEQFREKLATRSDISGRSTWYELRECNYYALFSQPKIIFPDIASSCRFTLDDEGFYVPDGAFLIPTDDTYLLGLLNSCIGDFYFRARCSSIGNPRKKGRLRFKKTYVSSFPVPVITDENRWLVMQIRDKAGQLCQDSTLTEVREEIDRLALTLYDIPKKMWRFFNR